GGRISCACFSPRGTRGIDIQTKGGDHRGHPGDPEYGCGGTILRLTELGHEVVLLYLNQGEPVESAARITGYRMEESKKACAVLKARPAYVGQIDANAVVDQSHYFQFREIIEKEIPN